MNAAARIQPARFTGQPTMRSAPSHPVVRNLMTGGRRIAHPLIARHAVGLPGGEIFVISTERRSNGQYLTTTTLLYYATIRRVTHDHRRQAMIDHAGEIRRFLQAGDALTCAAAG